MRRYGFVKSFLIFSFSGLVLLATTTYLMANLTGHTEALLDSLLTAFDSDYDGAFTDETWYTSLQQKLSEGAFVDGDKSKLDGIEAGATAFDPASPGDIGGTTQYAGSFISVTMTPADASPSTAGQIRVDSTVTAHANGALRWHDGTNIRQLVDMIATTAEECTDDQVVAYDAAIDAFYCKDDAGGAGATTLSGLTDVSGDGTQYYVLMDNGDNSFSFVPMSTFETIQEGYLDLPDLQGNLTLSRISDAGTAAAANTGTSSGNVPALVTCCSILPETYTDESSCTGGGGTWDAVCLGFGLSADGIDISDAGSIITATDVEGALQENRTAIDLNTAKTTNATHTGDVTGSGELTIAANAVGYTETDGSSKSLAPVVDAAADFSSTFTGSNLYGGTFICDTTGTSTLSAGAANQWFSYQNRGAVTPTIDPNGTEVIYLNGTSCGAGVTIVGGGAATDMAVFQWDGTNWEVRASGFTCGS